MYFNLPYLTTSLEIFKFEGRKLQLLPVFTEARKKNNTFFVMLDVIYTYFYTPLMTNVHLCQCLQSPYIPTC